MSKDEKAELLFQMYFEELNMNAFLPDAGPRWKLTSLNREVITTLLEPSSFRAIVKKVFDFQRFEIHPQWRNKFYMSQAVNWVKQKKGITQDLLECLLIETIRKMGIEHIHYAGDRDYNYNASVHIRVNMSDRTPREEVALLPGIEMSERDQKLNNGRKNNSKEFRDSEFCSLITGVNHYGEGKWKYILDDKKFPFVLKRTAKSLKDKWTRLKDSKAVHYDPDRRRWMMQHLNLRQNLCMSSTFPSRPFQRLPIAHLPPVVQPAQLNPAPSSEPNELLEAEEEHDVGNDTLDETADSVLNEIASRNSTAISSETEHMNDERRAYDILRIFDEPLDPELEGNLKIFLKL